MNVRLHSSFQDIYAKIIHGEGMVTPYQNRKANSKQGQFNRNSVGSVSPLNKSCVHVHVYHNMVIAVDLHCLPLWVFWRPLVPMKMSIIGIKKYLAIRH